jgi:peptide/nickel transport system permease protein
MLAFVVRRTFYSILIVLGVVLLTFLLFRLAAGDPAAAVLGKNPSPREVEDLRTELGADLPLFFGYWRKTEAFASVDFSSKRKVPGVKFTGEFCYGDDGVRIKEGGLELTRNFEIGKVSQQCVIRYTGQFEYNKKVWKSKSWSTAALKVDPGQAIVKLAGQGLTVSSLSFERRQKSPFNSQFIRSLGEIVSFNAEFPFISFFNFGRTVVTREQIRGILWRGVGPSLSVMLPIFIGELVFGIIFALIATAFKGTILDHGLVIVSIAGMSISYLVFIIFGQWFLGYYFNWFPVWGWGDIRYLALPVIIGILSGIGGNVRFYRTVFVNELNREYLRTAAAKGCSGLSVYSKHLLRNAAIPIITRASASLPFLFTGSLLLERFFGIPGLGYLGIDALDNSDLQLLKALVIVSAMLFVGINLVADITYAWADPRIRLSK